VAAVAVLAELSCVILGENVRPSEELLHASEERGVNLLCAGWSVYELTWRLHSLLSEEEGSESEARK
jgi:serine kinase of HPr protein (carbohydrate metabolism regulator)